MANPIGYVLFLKFKLNWRGSMRLSIVVSFIAASVFAAAFTQSNCSAAVIYDATSEFSTASNPNGVWSYQFSNDTVRDGTYSLLTELDPLNVGPAGGSLVWHADAGVPRAQRPFAGVNTTTRGTSSWAVGELAIHPGQSAGGSGAGMAILSWTSPVTGTADIDFSLAMGLFGNVLWFFERNDSSITLASGTLVGATATDTFSLSNISINTGDRLNFVVDSNGSVGSDLVRLTSATIKTNAVPEPSTFVVLALGAPLGLYRRYRRSIKRSKV